MQEVTTIPGKTYAVECAGEVVITNNETGAIAAQGDGSGQVLFTACSNSYSVSDDTAKVVALFKLAPRLKLTLLQGVAGGLLPAGFTELEYLESSGTQFLDTGLRGCDLSSSVECRAALNGSPRSMRMFQGQGLACTSNRADLLDCYVNIPVGDNLRKSGYLPPLGSQEVSYFVRMTNGAIEINGQSFTAADMQAGSSVSQNDAAGSTLKVLAYPDGVSYQSSWWVGKLCSFSAKLQNGEVRFIPALRKADGVAGMFDTVSKRFYTNAGSGKFGYRIKRTGEEVAPMSLRDPWRVAPSGVWAKLKAANELDIIADTEMEDGEPLGYTWHANTGEAYDAYGIVIQENFN